MSSNSAPPVIATIGIDLGKNTFYLVGLDRRGAIVLQLRLSRGQLGCRPDHLEDEDFQFAPCRTTAY
jgi:hypothetical protein